MCCCLTVCVNRPKNLKIKVFQTQRFLQNIICATRYSSSFGASKHLKLGNNGFILKNSS